MKARSIARAAFCLALACAGWTGPATAAPFSALYAFGDSLSDVGNVFAATSGAIPASPYFAGRFSNGPNWIDDLSGSLGLAPLKPSLAGGTDFAFGGAVTGPAVPGGNTAVPTITQQVGLFTLATGGHAPASALYTVWIGANDVFAALDGLGNNTLTLGQAQADLALAAQTEAGAVHALALEGAKTFIVPLIPDLGQTPDARDVGASTIATTLTQLYNAALTTALKAANAAVQNPAKFGFTDVTDRCYVGPLTGGGTVCATPATSLFWDGQHPTATGHAQIAALAAQSIPESPTAPLLVAALLTTLGLNVRWPRLLT